MTDLFVMIVQAKDESVKDVVFQFNVTATTLQYDALFMVVTHAVHQVM